MLKTVRLILSIPTPLSKYVMSYTVYIAIWKFIIIWKVILTWKAILTWKVTPIWRAHHGQDTVPQRSAGWVPYFTTAGNGAHVKSVKAICTVQLEAHMGQGACS